MLFNLLIYYYLHHVDGTAFKTAVVGLSVFLTIVGNDIHIVIAK